jgi:hypothetical protein
MRTPLALLNGLTIAAPCRVSWDEMKGDERVRHCDHCECFVHNLSEMSSARAAELVREKEGRFCVRFSRRTDGSMITADGPRGLRWKIGNWLRTRKAWPAAFLAFLFLPACTHQTMGFSGELDRGMSQTIPANDQVERKGAARTEQSNESPEKNKQIQDDGSNAKESNR